MGDDPRNRYPLGLRDTASVRTPSGVALSELTLASAREGRVNGGDLRATAETLRTQAAVARAAGRGPLADNLERAAELTAIPEDDLLAVYTALRPGRSSVAELEGWATVLQSRGATQCAAFVREAAVAYAARGLVG